MRGQWLSRMRGRLSGMRGQSTAEFALAVPIFLLLLFGAFEVGALLKTHAAYQEATISAARGGARRRAAARRPAPIPRPMDKSSARFRV